MKKTLILVCSIVFATAIYAQDPTSAAKGVTYGAGTTADGSVPVADLEKKMVNNKFEGKVTGKVVEVCQEKGCWMKIEKTRRRNADGEIQRLWILHAKRYRWQRSST